MVVSLLIQNEGTPRAVPYTTGRSKMMETILQDLRHGLRRLRRAPGFTLTALATLALGIGATTAIFTLAYQVILRSMPVEHPEQLYKVSKETDCCVTGGLQGDWHLFSYDLYRTLRDQTP